MKSYMGISHHALIFRRMTAKRKSISFNYERKLWQEGFRLVAGLDEAGRGPLAGPVVAAAVVFSAFSARSGQRLFALSTAHANPAPRSLIFPTVIGKIKGSPPHLKFSYFRCGGSSRRSSLEKTLSAPCRLRDSKKLSVSQRERWYSFLTNHRNIKWGIGVVSEKIIDKINILEATKLAMKKAIISLQRNCNRAFCDRKMHDRDGRESQIDFLLIDGNFLLEDLSVDQKAIPAGDEKIFSCAAASIIAKVSRDRLMLRHHQRCPQYQFDRHKGYGTKRHLTLLKKYGPSKIHRLSFAPCKNIGR